MRKTLIAVATAGVLATGAAFAGSTAVAADHGFVPVQYSANDRSVTDRWDERSITVNERQSRIKARIDRGVNDGRITRPEARRLYRQLASIESKERGYMADGHLNRREEAQLTRDLDTLASNLRTQLRDEDRSYSYNNPHNNPYGR